jgi:hypothetical protein
VHPPVMTGQRREALADLSKACACLRKASGVLIPHTAPVRVRIARDREEKAALKAVGCRVGSDVM